MADVEHAPGTGPGAHDDCNPIPLTYIEAWERATGERWPMCRPTPNLDYTADINPGVDIAGIFVAGCFIPWEAMNRG